MMLAQDKRAQIEYISRQIMNIDCPILDIGEKTGYTGYIDFITPKDFKEKVNKGIDMFDRRFVTFRAIIEYEDGKTTETFTTVFQRYTNNELLWMSAGRYSLLFYTDGGMILKQLELLYKLLTEECVEVTDDIYEHCRIQRSTYGIHKADTNKPKKIYLTEKCYVDPIENLIP